MTTGYTISNPLALYATSLLAEKLYVSKVFEGKEKEEIPYYVLSQNLHNNPQTSWDITVKDFPYLGGALQEVKDLLGNKKHAVSYWVLYDAIIWSIEEEAEQWRELVTNYEFTGTC